MNNNPSNIRDKVIKLFTRGKDEDIKHFLEYPCFACKNCITESSDEEYSMDSWRTCQQAYDDNGIEIFLEHQKHFPICKAPNKCIRNGWFEGTIDTNILSLFSVFDEIGYPLWHELDEMGCQDSPAIAGSVLGFHKRMSEYKPNEVM